MSFCRIQFRDSESLVIHMIIVTRHLGAGPNEVGVISCGPGIIPV